MNSSKLSRLLFEDDEDMDAMLNAIMTASQHPEAREAVRAQQQKKTQGLMGVLQDSAVQKALLKKGIDTTKLKKLGQGTQGIAFDIPGSGRVLKVTEDAHEASASNTLVGKSLKHVANVFGVWKFPNTNYYGIVLEKVVPFEQWSNDSLKDAIEEVVDVGGLKSVLMKTRGNWNQTRQEILQSETLSIGKTQQEMRAIEQAFDLLFQAHSEIEQAGLDFFDYNLGNLGKRIKDGSVVVFDIGYSKGGSTPPTLTERFISSLGCSDCSTHFV